MTGNDPSVSPLDSAAHRGWWLTGATIAQYHPTRAPAADQLTPPEV